MYELILIDFCMPQIDGPSFVQEFRSLIQKAEARMPFICCCSSDEEACQQIEVLGPCMDYFLAKPIKYEELVQFIEHFYES